MRWEHFRIFPNPRTGRMGRQPSAPTTSAIFQYRASAHAKLVALHLLAHTQARTEMWFEFTTRGWVCVCVTLSVCEPDSPLGARKLRVSWRLLGSGTRVPYSQCVHVVMKYERRPRGHVCVYACECECATCTNLIIICPHLARKRMAEWRRSQRALAAQRESYSYPKCAWMKSLELCARVCCTGESTHIGDFAPCTCAPADCVNAPMSLPPSPSPSVSLPSDFILEYAGALCQSTSQPGQGFVKEIEMGFYKHCARCPRLPYQLNVARAHWRSVVMQTFRLRLCVWLDWEVICRVCVSIRIVPVWCCFVLI